MPVRYKGAGCPTLIAIPLAAILAVAFLAGVAYLMGGCDRIPSTEPIHRKNTPAGNVSNRTALAGRSGPIDGPEAGGSAPPGRNV